MAALGGLGAHERGPGRRAGEMDEGGEGTGAAAVNPSAAARLSVSVCAVLRKVTGQLWLDVGHGDAAQPGGRDDAAQVGPFGIDYEDDENWWQKREEVPPF